MIAYVDGFNLYYGLREASRQADLHHRKHGGTTEDCLGRSLYWLDIDAMIRTQIPRRHECVAIKYFSAPRKSPELVPNIDKSRYITSNERQRVYFEALRTRPLIEVILGWYSENNPNTCERCGHQWPNLEEKVTDVNIATEMLCDAYERRADRLLLLSADADLVPAVKAVRRLGVEVVVLLPPGRKRAKHLRACASSFQGVRIRQLRGCRLPDRIERPPFPALHCPPEWRAGAGWVWDDRESDAG